MRCPLTAWPSVVYYHSCKIAFSLLLSKLAIDAPASYDVNTLSLLRIGAGQQSAKRPTSRVCRLPASHCPRPGQEAPRSKA